MLNTELEHKGYFWIPEKSDNQLAGILKFSQTDGITLDLFGHFDKYINPLSKEGNIVLGTLSNGKFVTLQSCFEHSRQMGIPGFPVSTISAINLFIGRHFNTPEEIAFSKLCIEYKDINEWLSISGFEIPEYNDVNEEVVIKYKRPLDLRFEIKEKWNLNIDFSYFGPSAYFKPVNKIEIRQIPKIIFEPNSEQNFLEFQDVFHVLNSFFSICYFSFPQIEKLEYSIEDKAEPMNTVKVEWYFRHGIDYKKLRKHENRHDFLIVYNDLENKAQDFLQNWYSLYYKMPKAINIMTEQFMGRSEIIEFRFLGLTQALESYHRRLFGGEVSFITRIESIIENTPTKIKNALLSNDTEFSKMIRDNRNYLTHHDERLEEEASSLGELFIFSEKMKIILMVSLMKKIGMSDLQVEKIIITKGVYLFNHLVKFEENQAAFNELNNLK